MKKQYETPKMNTIDFEYKTTLLAGSCGSENVKNSGFLSLNIDDVTNPKA